MFTLNIHRELIKQSEATRFKAYKIPHGGHYVVLVPKGYKCEQRSTLSN